MNIVLIGYGKMGHEIEKIALERGHTVINAIDVDNRNDLNSELAKQTDVAIEFTSPSSVIQNIHACFDLGIPIVTGSTGWHDKLGQISSECLSRNQSLFHSSNFSIGVNLFFALNEKLAELMESFQQYDVFIEEIRKTLPKVEAAIVKFAIGRFGARCIPPARSHELIRQAVAEGVRNAKKIKPLKTKGRIELETEFMSTAEAKQANLIPGSVRKTPRVVAVYGDFMPELWKAFKASHICGADMSDEIYG